MAFPGYNPFLASSSYLPSFSAGGAFSSPYGAAGAASGYSFPSAATYSAPTLGGYPFGGASASSALGSFGSYGAPSSYGSYSPVAQSGFSGLFPTAPTVTSGAYGASAYGSTYTPGASPFLLGGPKGGAPTAAPAAPTAPTYGQYAPTATHGAAAYPYAGAYGGFPGAFGATATHYNPHFAGAAAYGAAGAYGSPYGQRYPFAAAPGPINPYHQPRHVAPQPAAVPIRRSEYKNDDYYSDTSSNYSGYSGYYSN